MFVYLIIAIELTVLYVVFWIVFLREPRPREIRAELWGNYFKPTDRSVNNATQPEHSTNEGQSLYRTAKMKKIRRKKIIARRSSRSYSYCQLCSRGSHSRHAHGPTSLTQQASRTVVEKFLLSLNRALNKLSVKVP
jgi:hypothetical protein